MKDTNLLNLIIHQDNYDNFKEIYETLEPKIRGFLVSMFRRSAFKDLQSAAEDEAKDITGDVFMHLWKWVRTQDISHKEKEFDEFVKFKCRPYAFKIAICRAIDVIRKRERHLRYCLENSRDIVDLSPERQMVDRELDQRIESALQKLSDRKRRIISLRFYESQSYEVIAKDLNTTVAQAKQECYRVLRKLEKILKDVY